MHESVTVHVTDLELSSASVIVTYLCLQSLDQQGAKIEKRYLLSAVICGIGGHVVRGKPDDVVGVDTFPATGACSFVLVDDKRQWMFEEAATQTIPGSHSRQQQNRSSLSTTQARASSCGVFWRHRGPRQMRAPPMR